MTNDKLQFKLNFNRLVNKDGLSQRELAMKLGFPSGRIHSWMNGEQRPTLSNLIRLQNTSGVLACDLDPAAFFFNNTNTNQFFPRLLTGMMKKCLSIEEVAEDIGAARNTVIAWVIGEKKPGKKYITRLAKSGILDSAYKQYSLPDVRSESDRFEEESAETETPQYDNTVPSRMEAEKDSFSKFLEENTNILTVVRMAKSELIRRKAMLTALINQCTSLADELICNNELTMDNMRFSCKEWLAIYRFAEYLTDKKLGEVEKLALKLIN